MRACILKKLILISLFSLSHFAYAASTAAPHKENYFTPDQLEDLRKELLKKPVTENTIIPYGYLQADIDTSDSQRTNVPDFQGQHAIIGLLVKGGIVSGQVGIDLIGNQTLYSAPKTDTQGVTTTSPSWNNTVQLRRAQINIDALKLKDNDNFYTTTISVGGIRVGNAFDTAPDAANAPSGFSRQDGVYVQEKVSLGKTFDLNIGIGLFNTLYGTSPGSSSSYSSWGNNAPLTMQNFWLSTSLNPSLAYMGTLNTTYHFDEHRSLNFIAMYGFQNNAPYSTAPIPGFQTAGNLSEARNVNHGEASLLYQDANVFGDSGVITPSGVSVWYEREQNARTQLVTGNITTGFTYINGPVDDAQVATLYGVGIGADSDKYLTDMLQKKDRLTCSAAYSLVTSALGAPTLQQTYKVNQISGSVGYAVNTFEIAFNMEYSSADTNNIFIDKNGNPQNTEMKSYITTVYSF